MAEEAAWSRVQAGANTPSDVAAGLDLGRWVADQIIARARTDGADRQWDGARPAGIGSGPAFWEPPPGSVSPPVAPLAGTWRAWVLESNDQFRPPPPPAFGSPEFVAAAQEVVDVGRNLTPTQQQIARFYEGAEGTSLPAGLGGHSVLGDSTRAAYAGIRLEGRSGVTVIGNSRSRRGGGLGQVSGFDAGIFVHGGSGNTLTKLNVHDNVGPPLLSGDFGDGIFVLHSANNRILNNLISRNGVYDGIAILGLGSNNNTVQSNIVEMSTRQGVDVFGLGSGIVVNGFFEAEEPDRGESLSANNIVSNWVRNNETSGLTNVSNVGAVITRNLVENNGSGETSTVGPNNGIGVQALQQATQDTRVVLHSNIVRCNGRHDNPDIVTGAGVNISANQNQIVNNLIEGNNGRDGDGNIRVDPSSNVVSGNTVRPKSGCPGPGPSAVATANESASTPPSGLTPTGSFICPRGMCREILGPG